VGKLKERKKHMFSKLWTIKLSDWQRGLILAVISMPFTIILQSLQAGSLVFDWKIIITAALAGGFAYLGKNFSTGSGGKLLTNSVPPVLVPTTKQL
jgi:hypothetical protein